MVTVGLDEVGRGCWAGPLVAAAVILNQPIAGLRDSKKLSRLQREKLALKINAKSASHNLGWVWPAEIDEFGLTLATSLAMRRALDGIIEPYEKIIIDGNYNYLANLPDTSALIGADDLIPAVSAASIIAKVARDNYMRLQAEIFPDYGFDHHVGYGTKLHIAAIKTLGVCELHRLSYRPVQEFMGVRR